MLSICADALRAQLDEIPVIGLRVPPRLDADGVEWLPVFIIWPGDLCAIGGEGGRENFQVPLSRVMRERPDDAWHLLRNLRSRPLLVARLTLPSGRAIVGEYRATGRIVVRCADTGAALARSKPCLLGVPDLNLKNQYHVSRARTAPAGVLVAEHP